VLYLNPFSQEISGPDESLRTLLAHLVPKGVEAHVVLPALGPQVSRYEALGASVHEAPLAVLRRNLSLGAALYPGRLARSTLAVRSLARLVKADLIHTNMEVLLEGGLAARSLGLPHVLHYRGNTNDQPRWVFDGLTALWTTTADHVFCISKATARLFDRRGRGSKIEVMYNPVDTRAFAPGPPLPAVRESLGAGPGQTLIGTIGRVHPRKDLETFLRAAALVAGRLPEARFVVVGGAEAPIEHGYLDRLHQLVKELGIAERVRFAGARRDIPDVVRALDVFALTSRHEGFGRVVAEAMAAGRAVVVTDEGAPPELVGAGRNGLCARPADPDDFARQLLLLATDPRSAAALGARAAAAAAEFDAVTIAARVERRYAELLAARTSSRTS
jgi:glycosyltransferase involved in cell wall biosynthesis